jgi:hypothetical protein
LEFKDAICLKFKNAFVTNGTFRDMIWPSSLEDMELHVCNNTTVMPYEFIAKNSGRAFIRLFRFGSVVPKGWIFSFTAYACDFNIGQWKAPFYIINIVLNGENNSRCLITVNN